MTYPDRNFSNVQIYHFVTWYPAAYQHVARLVFLLRGRAGSREDCSLTLHSISFARSDLGKRNFETKRRIRRLALAATLVVEIYLPHQ